MISETQVKKQAGLLAKNMPIYTAIPTMLGKFVAFYNGIVVLADNHEAAFNQGEAHFGDKAFVIGEVSNKTLVLSSLVKF